MPTYGVESNVHSNRTCPGATALQVITVAFPNPEWSPSASNTLNKINSTLSFTYLGAPFHLTTLSTTGTSPGNDVIGLLYVPDLRPQDPCIAASEPHVPQNVTRRSNLPSKDYDLVAIAPWLSPQCTLKYLESARHDPIRGFLFFLPDNSSSPPPADDATTWSLGDNVDWKHDHHFPVYAIPGQTGNILMRASSAYSGNMTEVPDGHLLSEYYDSRDYVRLFADVATSGGTTLPSLWVFLLVVLGILLAVIGFTSLAMHWLQRRRRQVLRRRVANGEVDLEALGIKRLTVPQEVLDGMPLYTYGSGAPVQPGSIPRETTAAVTAGAATAVEVQKPEQTTEEGSRTPSPQPQSTTPAAPPALIRSTSYRPTPLQQPTCAICLDDFVAASSSTTPSSDTAQAGTIVRELPCHHIFHPECVDAFLRDSSSLCPMCKKTALPRGYCPRVVTNAMVRRERMVRRIRPTAGEEEHQDPEALDREVERRTREGRWGSVRGAVAARRVASMPLPLPRTSSAREMTELPNSSTAVAAPATAVLARSTTTASRRVTTVAANATPVQPPSNPRRREWARQRAIAMLGRHRAPLDPDAEEAAHTSGWRKVVRGIFPGVRGSRGGER